MVKGRKADVLVGLLPNGGIWWKSADSRKVMRAPGARMRITVVKMKRARRKIFNGRETARLKESSVVQIARLRLESGLV